MPIVVGAQLRLLKPVGAVLCSEHRVVSIPTGQTLTIKSTGHNADRRIVTADWNGKEVFVFREDLVTAIPKGPR